MPKKTSMHPNNSPKCEVPDAKEHHGASPSMVHVKVTRAKKTRGGIHLRHAQAQQAQRKLQADQEREGVRMGIDIAKSRQQAAAKPKPKKEDR
jgi:hypothetical protein